MLDGSGLYSADQVVDKDLFALKKVTIYSLPTTQSTITRTVNAGDGVGTVYSYVQKTDGLWWQFYSQNPNYPDQMDYARHETGLFDMNKLVQQGALTTDEKIAKEQYATMDFWQTMYYWFQKYAVWGIIFGGAYIGYHVYQNERKRK